MNPDGTDRLAKVLARRGVASRRDAETMITEGRVTVDGQAVTHPGHPVNPETAIIRVDGKRISGEQRKIYLLLNKPKGYITGREDPQGRRSVIELLGALPQRVEPVGRLDFNTEGALVLTNDGELAHALTHPSKGVPKRYLAKVYRCPTESTIERMEKGVLLEDGKSAPCKVRVVKLTDNENAWLEITVTEGRNRLVRRLLAAVGHPVAKLRRESFATITVRGLELGAWRELTGEELTRLREIAHGVPASAAGRKTRPRKIGFAKPDPAWLEKRLDGRKGGVKKGMLARGRAAR